MESIKRRVKVTIEKEFDIEFTPALFGGMSEEEYLAEFSKSLWHVDSMDDVAKYAARIAAHGGAGHSHDGLGRLCPRGLTYGKTAHVLFDEVRDECEEEILP